MASARKRGKKWMGLYRDADGRQRSAGSYATKKAALEAAKLAEAGVMPVKTEVVYPSKVRGKVTVASYATRWLANHPMAPHTAVRVRADGPQAHRPGPGRPRAGRRRRADVRAMFRSVRGQRDVQGAPGQDQDRHVARCSRLPPKTADPGQRRAWRPLPGGPAEAQAGADGRRVVRVRRYLTGEYRLLGDVRWPPAARIEESPSAWRPRTSPAACGTSSGSATRSTASSPPRTRPRPARTGSSRSPAGLAGQIKAAGPGRVFTDFRLDTYRQCHWYPACKAAGLDWRPAPRDLRRTFATLARAGGADLEAIRWRWAHGDLARRTCTWARGPRPGPKPAGRTAGIAGRGITPSTISRQLQKVSGPPQALRRPGRP